ncbi:MAG: hypothetical protein ASARMPRED_002025 [Alectoria sarmentosa]|nr:MAG: hypothetical protein ASARMPRED_002025 [Alectoria sarmentosa]
MKAATKREGLEKDPIELDHFLEEEQEHIATIGSLRLLDQRFWPWIVHLILFSIALLMILVNSTPVLSLVNEGHQTLHFNNSDHTFRGPPSESVSEAWDRLTEIYPFSIPSRETLENIGADPDTSVELPAEYGGGYEGILGMTHQLHCIKNLWQYSYYDYFQTRNSLFADPPEAIHGHLDHCADLVRQNILCQADVSIITFDWVKGRKHPQPHYGNPKECRNYEDILAWAVENQAPVPPGNKIRKPDGAMEREMPG